MKITKTKKATVAKAKKISVDFPSHKKNLDNLKLVFSVPGVKDIINDARKILKLPPGGLMDPSHLTEWHASTSRRSQQILNSKEFRDQITSIKQRIAAKELDLIMAEKQLDLLHNKLPENYLIDTINYIIDAYKLPTNYTDSIRTYILLNILHAPPHGFSEGPYVYTEKVDRSKFVTITFYSKLTDADLKKLKTYVNNLAGNNMPDFQPLTEIDKKIKSTEMYDDREKFDTVTQTYYKMTAKEIAENISQEFNSKTTASDVYEYVREIKDLRKKRFGSLGNST